MTVTVAKLINNFASFRIKIDKIGWKSPQTLIYKIHELKRKTLNIHPKCFKFLKFAKTKYCI